MSALAGTERWRATASGDAHAFRRRRDYTERDRSVCGQARWDERYDYPTAGRQRCPTCVELTTPELEQRAMWGDR